MESTTNTPGLLCSVTWFHFESNPVYLVLQPVWHMCSLPAFTGAQARQSEITSLASCCSLDSITSCYTGLRPTGSPSTASAVWATTSLNPFVSESKIVMNHTLEPLNSRAHPCSCSVWAVLEMSPPVPIQYKRCFMGLVKQVKMQLQLWPDTLEEANFSVFFFFCHVGKKIISLPFSFNF